MNDHVLVVGEALVDVVMGPDGTAAHPGGSPANVALGLARLGRDVDLLTRLGLDPNGVLVADHLQDDGVRLVPGSAGPGPTSVATATLDAGGAATYEFDIAWELADGVRLRNAPLAVHTGSIAAVMAPGAEQVLRLVHALRFNSTVTYDPNVRPSLMGSPDDARPAIERMVGLADVVKASDEDLGWLYPDRTVDEAARAWAGMGPALVVVTRGGDGATAFTHDGREIHEPAPAVTVADTVGAGDSFMAGLIDGLWGAGLLGRPHRDALRGMSDEAVTGLLRPCARIAAITVSRPGANPPTRAELDAP
ncbi:carbohydrate kinase [Demequina sp. SYSU T00192]|uniref:Carbohydrate kinase n=1 Tax=Demequina litoralis TaxID=3051660 RepID=A0ABT8G913_9MICO|nr:carbohydrate kinase [Demequina sp. SYSU T00192]MDN4475630.1 carbohydrate kinase [Demequina sp. SYSU T00192]